MVDGPPATLRQCSVSWRLGKGSRLAPTFQYSGVHGRKDDVSCNVSEVTQLSLRIPSHRDSRSTTVCFKA